MKWFRWIAIGLTFVVVLVLGGSLVMGVGSQARSIPPPRVVPTIPDGPRVEVLNAAGISGMAQAATDQLRSARFDVVYFGNAAEFGRDSSVVIDRVGKPEIARNVARELGIEQVRSEPDSTLYLEATVLLGLDWRGVEPRDTLISGN